MSQPGADRYILFCDPMFVPAFVLSQPTFWDRPLFHINLQKNSIDIPVLKSFCQKSLHVCVATSVSIRTNFRPDLISFPVHRTPLSRCPSG